MEENDECLYRLFQLDTTHGCSRFLFFTCTKGGPLLYYDIVSTCISINHCTSHNINYTEVILINEPIESKRDRGGYPSKFPSYRH